MLYETRHFFRSILFAILAVSAPLVAFAGTPTTTSLAISSGGVPVTNVPSGSVVTLTATVSAHPGLVEFCDATAKYCTDEHRLGIAQVTTSGTATYSFFPTLGKHSYKAVFVGTTANTASSSQPQALVVTGATTTITSTGAPGAYTLTATVAGSVFASGNISFLDNTNANLILNSAALASVTSPVSFAAGSPLAVGPNPQSVAVGDFNGDGIPDLAVTNYSDQTVMVLLGNGDGTFATGSPHAVGVAPASVAVGDFNGDGILDLAVANNNGNTVTVLLGKGDGTFTTSSTPSAGIGPVSIAVGDFNGDGIPDLAVADNGGNSVTVLLGKGDGTFTISSTPGVGIAPDSIAVGDFNGDGIPDLVTANRTDNTATVLLGRGDGTFAVAKGSPITVGSVPFSVAVGDFNGDGIPDLAVANEFDDTVTVLLGKGDGTFTTSSTPAVGFSPASVAVGDLNGDGITDLVTANEGSNSVTVLLGRGDGTFTTSSLPAGGFTPYSAAVGDFNGDGIPDLITVNYNNASVTVLLNRTSHQATATINNVSVPGSGAHTIEASYAGDANYVPGFSSNTVSLLGTELPTMLKLSSSLSTASYGQQVVLTATLSPYSSGNLSTNAENVVFQSNGANLGIGSLSSGVAVLNTTSLPVGADSITAVYGGDANFVTSVSAATTVTVTQTQPIVPTLAFAPIANQTTGAAPFTVSATSASSGTVTYAVTSGPATISGTTVTVTGVGTVVLTANQAATGNYTAATATTSFTVTAATGVPLDFTINSSGASQTVVAGAAVTYNLQLAPTAGTYPSSVSFSASGLPNGASYNFSPALVPANSGPVAIGFTVDSSALKASNSGIPFGDGLGRGLAPVAFALLLLPVVGTRRMRKHVRLLCVLLSMLGGALVLTGCGGSSGSAANQPQSYNITITATSGTDVHTTTVTLQVQ